MTVLEELDMLVKETKELLDGPDPAPEAWQAYGEKPYLPPLVRALR